MVKGHGTHWETIYPDVGAFAKERLFDLLRETPALWEREIPPVDLRGDGSFLGDLVLARAERQGALRHQLILVRGVGTRRGLFFSGYPLIDDGLPYDFEVSRAVPWEFGIEGQVDGSVGNASVRFFDPHFLLNSDRYVEGRTLRVRFAALGYDLARAETYEWNVADFNPELAETMRREGGRGDEPVRLSTAGAAIMLPMDDWDIDDFKFQARIKHIETVAFGEVALVRLLVAPMLVDDLEFVVPLFVATHNIEQGFEPKVGDDVTGSFWLTGTVEEREGA